MALLSPAAPPALRGGPATRWSLLDVCITKQVPGMRWGQHPASPLASANQHVRDAWRGVPKAPHGPGEGTGPWAAPWSRPWPHYAKSWREPSARGAEMPGRLDSNTRGHLGLCVCPDGTVRRSVMSDSATPRNVALQAPLSMGFSR